MSSNDSERPGNRFDISTPTKGKSYYFFSGVFFFMVLVVGMATFLLGSSVLENNAVENEPPGSYQTMDYGPVLAESISLDWPENSLVRKGLAIRLDHEAAMIFDTDLLRFAAGVAGGWLDLSKTDYTSFKGSENARVEGRQVFGSPGIAGWASEGSFYGPREDGMGNLPRDWARYKGYYRHGDRVVLSYSVGRADVLELPGAIKQGEALAFVRTLQVSPTARPMKALILEMRDGWSVARATDRGIVLDTGAGALGIRLVDAPDNAVLAEEEGRLELNLSASANLRSIRLMIFEMNAPEDPLYAKFPTELGNSPVPDLREWVQGGPSQWNEELKAAGTPAGSDQTGAYVIDRIGIPFDNPWGSWMKLSGLDFFDDGTRAAVSTQNGDVWIVSGIDQTLDNVRWRRFASGLFYPMGVAIVDGQIYVTERSQLTRLRDLNGDGEADYYENINNDGIVHPMAHTLGLEVDYGGYFYFFKNGNRVPAEVPQHGALARVSPDGASRKIYGSGFRSANTMGIGPDDAILTADQEGNWVPVERINVVKEEGGFYGYRPHGGERLPVGEFETPVAWMPRSVNNSSGSLTYAGDPRWGPLSGHWILGSYGQGTLLAVLTEQMKGRLQGGVVELPLQTNTGLVRGRMNPADGQLYLLGMSNWGRTAWDAEAIDQSSFLRVRYAGGSANLPRKLRVTPQGVEIGFTDPLNPESGRNVSNYRVERWEYVYSARYGSPEMSLERPGEEGRDAVAVSSVRLSEDRTKVFLEIPDMHPVMQMGIAYRLRFADGSEAENTIYHTVNWLSAEQADGRPEWQQRIMARYQQEVAEETDTSGESSDIAEEDMFGGGEAPEWFREGRASFQTRCSECHVNGGVAPSFEASAWAAASSPEAMIRILLHGKRSERGIMAPFSWMKDEEVAAVISYIRGRWHEKPEPVSASQIKQTRKKTEGRRDFYTEEELRAINE